MPIEHDDVQAELSPEKAAPDPNDMELCAKAYLKLRTKKQKIEEEAKSKVELIERDMLILSQHMLQLMGTSTSQRVDGATVIKSIKQKFWSTDWAAFEKFCKDTDNLGLFERRIAQKNMAEWLEKNPDKIPAGLQMDRRYEVTVRKLPKKAE